MGYVLANTALSDFYFEQLVEHHQYATGIEVEVFALVVICFVFSLGMNSGPHSLQFARLNACR